MDFAKSALIVVDINRTHFDMELNYLPVPPEDAKRVIDKVSQVVIPQFRLHKRPIIYIKTAHRINPLTGEAMSVASPYWRYQMERRNVTGVGQKRKALAVEGSKVTEIMPELEVRPEDLIVVKQRYSPFVGTDLERILSVMNIDTLFLVGANTNNCVLSTAFEAFNRDFGVVLIEDCCASMNGEKFHQIGVEQIRASLGWVITSDQVEGLITGTMTL
jgi:nicotinamidase-related amidase